MIGAVNPSIAQFLANLDSITQRSNRAQNEVSSGLKLTEPSDSPGDVNAALEAQADLDQTTQIVTNLGQVTSQTNTAESALENAVSVVQQVTQLGAEGATGTQTSETRSNLASQVQTLQQQLVGIANTSFEGRYVFSGDQDGTQPYTVDPGSPTGVASNIEWSSTQATQQAIGLNGETFPIAQTAGEIFDSSDANGNPTAANVFAAVNALQLALQNNPSVQPGDPQYQSQSDAQQAAINAAMASLQTASDHLNQGLAFYGNVQDRVAAATNDANNRQTYEQTALSNAEDADLPSAISEMTEDQIDEQATLAAQAQLPKSSLFNYLG
jgi:flagellar hook-associated protein 3 FlgL